MRTPTRTPTLATWAQSPSGRPVGLARVSRARIPIRCGSTGGNPSRKQLEPTWNVHHLTHLGLGRRPPRAQSDATSKTPAPGAEVHPAIARHEQCTTSRRTRPSERVRQGSDPASPGRLRGFRALPERKRRTQGCPPKSLGRAKTESDDSIRDGRDSVATQFPTRARYPPLTLHLPVCTGSSPTSGGPAAASRRRTAGRSIRRPLDFSTRSDR